MADGTPSADAEDELPRLALREPLPAVIEDPTALRITVEAVRGGCGPVAIDAERASGYRYSGRAYLVQLRREGFGTALIDPIPLGDLEALNDALGDSEWIVHAATQDLPCLAELGLRPTRLFDTELAGRLLNIPRVGLASLVKDLLGFSLAKEHSAADWSVRPLPAPWLEYAALDVEMLVELREVLVDRLRESGKLAWAHEEFEALTRFAGPAVRAEPWRRVSGIHRARARLSLGIVRALWEARDLVAADTDTTPGRILSDAAIMEAAIEMPKGERELRSLPTMRHRAARQNLTLWSDTVAATLALAEDELPTLAARYDGPPPARAWPERNPVAAARLAACREALRSIAAQHDLPTENLVAPDVVRRLAWEPPAIVNSDTVAAALRALSARPWQVGLTSAALADALVMLSADDNVG
ncbi:MAG: ribonuclease D [Nocardioidaceae bacterium]|nr:ribonuclease D [Nocardioidaceae bacterium]